MNDELGFEHLTKRQLVKFCKKFHKDCYRLVGQKMKLKDQLTKAKELIRELIDMKSIYATNKEVEHRFLTIARAEQFLKEIEK